jgi:hypothetical protein
MRMLVFCFAVAWPIAVTAIAGEACKPPAACTEVQTCGSPDRCGRCGCGCPCEKYCRVVCEMKEVKKTVWVVKCEDFCAPLPGCRRDCRCGGNGCENCDAEAGCSNQCAKKCDPCAKEESKCIVPPRCGKVRERKVLQKKEIVCKVPSYKCVVVYCCPNCEAGRRAAPPAPASDKPTASPPAPGRTTQDAPLPPVMSASYLK